MFDWLFRKAKMQEVRKPNIGLEFRNVQATKLLLWLEPYCIEIALEPTIEYRVESDGTEYSMHFSGEDITIYLNDLSGPKVLKRPYSPGLLNNPPWELDADYSNY